MSTGTKHRGIDPAYPDAREAPALGPLFVNGAGPSRPYARAEPVLDVANIQGNLVGGFNKNFQTLLFLRIEEPARFKDWLVEFASLVATAEEVIAFNRLYKWMRGRRGHSGLRSSWINIAFSYEGLKKLREDADTFADASFRSGLVARSPLLGDPTATDAEGHPGRWLVRDGEGGVEVLIVVASDTVADLEAEVARVEQQVFTGSGASILFKQEGRAQLGTLAGHEHFGFLDGVSQPGLRGRVSSDPHDVLTPRQTPRKNPADPDRQNPADPDQGKPGQELVWPGEFVFGYPGQNGSSDGKERGGNSLFDGAGYPLAPPWAKDGAYLVFRRLRQDVYRFHRFLRAEATRLDLDPEALGARLVGRWSSGAPTMRAPDRDNPRLADDDCANNNFGYARATEPALWNNRRDRTEMCSDNTYDRSPGDPLGEICPYAAHIRKAYPRDDVLAALRLRRRLLRRGIPFGPSSRSTPRVPVDDGIHRGLLFMAYMTSIVDQFEYVTKEWINNPNLDDRDAGVDPILGQVQAADGSRRRSFNVRIGGSEHRLTTSADWVIPTGGGYFFAPSLKALRNVLGSRNRAEPSGSAVPDAEGRGSGWSDG